MKLCCCCRFLTAGLLFLTLSYVGMVVLMKYYLRNDCLDGDDAAAESTTSTSTPDNGCMAEGVDNTILNWSSDLFVAFFCFVFALHLSLIPTEVRKSAVLALVFLGGSFILAGIGHWMYPNSGLDDDQGLLGFWIVWMGSNVFAVISGLGTAHFALSVTRNVNPVRFNPCWASSSRDRRGTCFPSRYIVAVCELLLVLSLSIFLTGGVWCSVSSELQVDTLVDEVEAGTSDVHACFSLMFYGDLALHVTYALLWLPVGFLLRAASWQWPQTILGLPTHMAAGTAMVLQWSAGSMFPVYLMITAAIRRHRNDDNNDEEEETFLQLWQRVYGSVIYHWGMLLTLYCLHNLAYGLPKGCIEEDHPAPWSMEWLLCKLGFGPENDPSDPHMKKITPSPPPRAAAVSKKKAAESKEAESKKVEDMDLKSAKSFSSQMSDSEEEEEEEEEEDDEETKSVDKETAM
jgi:hypothetical protein